jgi:hypothetical protein
MYFFSDKNANLQKYRNKINSLNCIIFGSPGYQMLENIFKYHIRLNEK